MSRARQGGAVWLGVLLTLALVAGGWLLTVMDGKAIQLAHDYRSEQALTQAREALIDYALTYADAHPGEVPGYLPCPDWEGGNPEGSAEIVCGARNVSALGRFPWRTLNLPLQRDGDGECLWYAVSGNYKNNPKTELMNPDTWGQFEVWGADGSQLAGREAAQRAVAVVFAPGMALDGQARSTAAFATLCGGNYTATNYLDHPTGYDNAATVAQPNALSRFLSGRKEGANDRLAYITAGDVFAALLKRADFRQRLGSLAQATAECLAAYADERLAHPALPWAAPLVLDSYGANASYNDQSGLYAGRVPYLVDTSKAAGGGAISGTVLLNAANCPASWGGMDAWWGNWKDHLFYVLAPSQAPGGQAGGCCLTVNGQGAYVAVILFAGDALAGQSRADKGRLAGYLEGRNAGLGNDLQSGPATPGFDDLLYCVDASFAVQPCPS